MILELQEKDIEVIIEQLGLRLECYDNEIIESGVKQDVDKMKETISTMRPIEIVRLKLINCMDVK